MVFFHCFTLALCKELTINNLPLRNYMSSGTDRQTGPGNGQRVGRPHNNRPVNEFDIVGRRKKNFAASLHSLLFHKKALDFVFERFMAHRLVNWRQLKSRKRQRLLSSRGEETLLRRIIL